jgi:hypothetical protein
MTHLRSSSCITESNAESSRRRTSFFTEEGSGHQKVNFDSLKEVLRRVVQYKIYNRHTVKVFLQLFSQPPLVKRKERRCSNLKGLY